MSNASKNDITGDSIITKISSQEYRNNFDMIFRKSKEVLLESTDQQKGEQNEIQKTDS